MKIITNSAGRVHSGDVASNPVRCEPSKVHSLKPNSIAPQGISSKPILAFWCTENQESALASTVSELRKRNIRVEAVSDTAGSGVKIRRKMAYPARHHGMKTVLKSLLLLVVRAPHLFRERGKSTDMSLFEFARRFTAAHRSLIFFDGVIQRIQPALVMVSNDHEVQNRCLIALARQGEIPTVYLQHASVSRLFPALSFDYAFLDGKFALDLYLECEPNKPDSLSLPSQTSIILSGVKRVVVTERKRNPPGKIQVGFAMNHSGITDAQLELLSHLSRDKFSWVVRWRPGPVLDWQLASLEQQIETLKFEKSDPSLESQAEFLNRISGLVAPETSLHLEASIAGVPSIMLAEDSGFTDYYGFVRSRLVQEANSVEEIEAWLQQLVEGYLTVNFDAVEEFSATFNTEWQNREGELVALMLEALLKGEDPETATNWNRSLRISRPL